MPFLSARKLLLIMVILLPVEAFAAPVSGIGMVANNLMDPVSIMANFIGVMSIVVGISFLTASFFKYMQHRMNPMVPPISTPVTLFIMGVVLICLPLAYKLTESGIQIHL